MKYIFSTLFLFLFVFISTANSPKIKHTKIIFAQVENKFTSCEQEAVFACNLEIVQPTALLLSQTIQIEDIYFDAVLEEDDDITISEKKRNSSEKNSSTIIPFVVQNFSKILFSRMVSVKNPFCFSSSNFISLRVLRL